MLRYGDISQRVFTWKTVPDNVEWVATGQGKQMLCISGQKTPINLLIFGTVASLWLTEGASNEPPRNPNVGQ